MNEPPAFRNFRKRTLSRLSSSPKKRLGRVKGIVAREINNWKARHSRPPYRPNHERIIIDITSFCDLGCSDCNRSCGHGQARSFEFMEPEQVEKFVHESREKKKRWKLIQVEGGEPSLHPRIEDIFLILSEYKERYSPWTKILFVTNGYGPKAKELLSRLPEGIGFYNSHKISPASNLHYSFNIAPRDLAEFREADYSEGCPIPQVWGSGLTRHGYYPHPICGGIDRVLGLDAGRKNLPDDKDRLADQMQRLCPYCGHFKQARLAREKKKDPSAPRMSPSWVRAYEEYRRKKPEISLY